MRGPATRYRIYCERADGSKFFAFTWRGTLESGKARALLDAKLRGVDVKHVWGIGF